MTGYLFPNEGPVQWDLLITIYPFITGLVAGAFIVASLYHLFGIKSLKPVARFSLITALAFLLVTPLPLTVHLGRPERAAEMFFTPHLTSAMSAFGYIWLMYLILVLAEIWLIYRADLVRYAQNSEGMKKAFYTALALGVMDVSAESLATDHKIVKGLALVGIPAAILLHGYVGFIFGAVKANPWWSTPLMPVIFLTSAIVSGIGLLIVLYVFFTRVRRQPVDQACLRALSLWLLGFLSINVVLEVLEVFTMLYESEESWGIISQLITQKISFSYFGIQFVAGAVIPFFTLGGLAAFNKVSERIRTVVTVGAAALVIIGVFAMRWNVVIGGQLISKSLRGLNDYVPPLVGEGSILVASLIMLLPVIILIILNKILPPWQLEPAVTEMRQGLSRQSLHYQNPYRR